MKTLKVLCAVFAVLLSAFIFVYFGIDKNDSDSDYDISVSGNMNVSSIETESETDVYDITLICVGDSITRGDGSGDVVAGSYTTALKEMVPKGCTVLNFGRSGSTALNDTYPHTPYTETKEYKDSLLSEPNIVIIMLGTNDSWYASERGEDEYRRSLESIINDYESLDSRPEIFLCTPPERFTEDECSKVTDELIVPQVKAVCEKRGITLIDIHQVTKNHRELYYDGIHLNKNGYRLVASKIYSVLSETENFLNK